jgi:hypothetical protein
MNMVLNLNALPSKAGIKKSYPDAKVRNVEYHAHIVDKVPERVLEHTCPTGFANAYRAERTKAAGTHVEL